MSIDRAFHYNPTPHLYTGKTSVGYESCTLLLLACAMALQDTLRQQRRMLNVPNEGQAMVAEEGAEIRIPGHVSSWKTARPTASLPLPETNSGADTKQRLLTVVIGHLWGAWFPTRQ